MTFNIGDLIGKRYKIIEELDGGGFGEIFIAEDLLKFNSKCLIKQFIQSYDEQSEIGKKARDLFKSEAKILHHLERFTQTPNLLAFLENEECIVQELIDGESLLDELSHKTLDEDQILNLLIQILPVLGEIHSQGILHRDIKPDNIMRKRGSDQLVLIDFGIAKQVSELAVSMEQNTTIRILRSTNMGTLGYQAPESFSSPAGDLYSLGATCFHLLTGYHPLYADERSWINVDMKVRRKTSTILKKLFDENLTSRYQNTEEVLQDIRALENVQRIEKINLLLSLLTSTDEGYRSQAINELAEFGSDARVAIPHLIDILQQDNYQLYSSASTALAKIGEDSVPFLAELLKNQGLEIRRRAASTLEQIGELAKAALPQLIQALEDSDPDGDIRWYSVITIGKIGVAAQEAIPALIKRLKDPKAGIRAWALYALGRMGNFAQEAEPIIIELLSNEEKNNTGNNVLIAGIEALDSIGANIDEIKITSFEDNSVRTAREWVFFVREQALRDEEAARQQAKARGVIRVTWRRPLSAHTPPQRDPSQFRKLFNAGNI